MTQANLRGGYIKTLEISQDESHQSKCMLSDELLKKADNYVLQVTRFISNVTPNVNTYDENVFEVLRRPGPNDNFLSVAAIANQNLPESIRMFRPQNVKTTLELARQMMVFSNLHDGLSITLNEDNTIRISMTLAFGTEYYIRVGPITRKLLGLREYLFYFQYQDLFNVDIWAINNEYFPENTIALFLADVVGNFFVFRAAVAFAVHQGGALAGQPRRAPILYESENTISCLDTRLSLDVEASFPISTQHQILNGVESHDFLLGRFPINDYIDHHVSYTDRNQYSVMETVNLGLEDLCRKNPETITNYLMPGEIRVVNISVRTRYIEDQKIKVVDTDYSNGGFFSLKLMFSKKQK
jgi:hypothetical protein